MTKILITGGLGYLGGRIAQHLSSNLDNHIIIASRDAGKYQRPSWLTKGEIISLDLFDQESLNRAVMGVDVIVHLAALNEIDSGKYPADAVRVNTEGSVNLLKCATAQQVKRFIYFSTAHIYGAPLIGDLSEQTLPRAAHPYSITHKATEDFVLAAHDRKEIEAVVIRLSNGFGAPERFDVNRWTLLVNDLCLQAVKDKQLVLKSAGLQKRDFITLQDVARSVEHFIQLDTANLGDGIFNVGGKRALSIIEMTEMVADRCQKTLGFRPEIIKPDAQPNEKGDDLNYIIDRLTETGFQLSNNFEEEIDNTLLICQAALQ